MKILLFDIEANGLDDADTVWMVSTKDAVTGERRTYRQHQVEDGVRELYSADVIIGHNIINYDVPTVDRILGIDKPKSVKVIDTYLLSMLLSPDRQKPFGMVGRKGTHSLEAWGYRAGVKKPEHDEWHRFSEEMVHRCEQDVEITEYVYKTLCAEGSLDYTDPYKDSPWLDAIKLEQQVQLYINEVEKNGFPVSEVKITDLISFLDKEMSVIADTLVLEVPPIVKQYGVTVTKPFKKNGEVSKMVSDWVKNTEDVMGPFTRLTFEPFNLGSDLQIKEYLLSIGWIPTEYTQKKVTERESRDPQSPYYKQTIGRQAVDKYGSPVQGGPKLTEDSFASLNSDIGQRFAKYLKHRHRHSLLTGLQKLINPKGRVSQRFMGLTSTGRYKHAGLVNMPGTSWLGHEIRQCFITIPNYKLVGTDAASCQLRMLAHYMGDPDYIKTVCDGIEVDEDTGVYYGTDIHTTNGIACGLIDEKVVLSFRGRQEKSFAHDTKYHALKEGRRKAKNFIYGYLFGAGPATIAATIGTSVGKARKVMTQFRKALPALDKLLTSLDNVYKKRGYFMGLDGRRIVIRSPHMKLVYLLQNAEAVFMKVAWCYLREGAKRAGIAVQSVCFSHDEFQELVPDERLDDYTRIAQDAFRNAGLKLKLKCPTAGSPKVGIDWSETH